MCNVTDKICRQQLIFGDLVQDCSIPIANALEILQPCTKPSYWTEMTGKYNGIPQCQGIHTSNELQWLENNYQIPFYSLKLCISGHFCLHGSSLISAWISNHMPCEVRGEITYPFTNFNGSTDTNFSPHFIMDVITYLCWAEG